MLNTIIIQTITDTSALVDSNISEQIVRWIMSKAVGIGTKIIIAVVIFIVGSSIISVLRKLIKRLLIRKKIDSAVASFVNSLANMLLKIALWVFIIGVLGIPTMSFAAIIAAGGLAVGMAMKDNLSNFAGGVMILLNKPFRLQNSIIAQGQSGVVKEIGILYTVLLTSDGKTIYLPNGPLSTGSIVNLSVEKNRRIDLVFNIGYGNSADELIEIIREVINTNPLIQQTPAPFVGVTTVYNSNFDITVRVWGLNAHNSQIKVELNEAIYRTLKDKGIFLSPVMAVKMT